MKDIRLTTTAFVLLALFSSLKLSAINYYSAAAGLYNNAGSWTVIPGVPPNTIPVGDTVFINHNITTTGNIDIDGVLEIGVAGILAGGHSIKIEFDGYLNNDGNINITKDLHIDGYLYNTGLILVQDVHCDAYICNSGLIILEPGEKFNLHGGIIECCGTILTDELEVHKNSFFLGFNNPGTINCQNICNTTLTGPPTYSGVTENEFLNNLDPTESLIDRDNVTICGVVLPAIIVDFKVESGPENQVQISWTSEAELNSDFYTISRSFDGQSWDTVKNLVGAGTSRELLSYSVLDFPQRKGTVYYKLSLTDFSGATTYAETQSVELSDIPLRLRLFPNPARNNVEIQAPVETKTEEIAFYDVMGKQLAGNLAIENMGEGHFKINIENLERGVYFIKIGNETQRLVKN